MKYLLSWTLALGWQLWLLLVPALCDAQLFFSVAGLANHFEEREYSQSGGMSLLIRSQKTNFHLASALSLSQSLSLLLTPWKEPSTPWDALWRGLHCRKWGWTPASSFSEAETSVSHSEERSPASNCVLEPESGPTLLGLEGSAAPANTSIAASEAQSQRTLLPLDSRATETEIVNAVLKPLSLGTVCYAVNDNMGEEVIN